MVVCAHQMVTGRLACRIRAVRLITMDFTESRRTWGQRAINLVSRHMEKAKRLLGFSLQAAPVTARCFQKPESAYDVGLNEVFRAMNGTVDMTLGGKIYDGARPVTHE